MTVIIYVLLNWIIDYKGRAISGFCDSKDNFDHILRVNQFNPKFSFPEVASDFSFHIQPNMNKLFVSFIIDEGDFLEWAETNKIALQEISTSETFSWVDRSQRNSIVIVVHGIGGKATNWPGRLVYDRHKKICYLGSLGRVDIPLSEKRWKKEP